MAATNLPTAAQLREFLDYNPETGKFKHRKGGRSRWRETVGYMRKDGYIAVYCGPKQYLAHRLVWLWMTGEWPKQDIDHINRNRADNRWCNLRDVSRSENLRNNRLEGRAGICWDEYYKSWKVYLNRKPIGQIHIGRYSTWEKAMQIAELLRRG